jgi:Dockerin type I domain
VGDINKDAAVDAGDLSLVLAHWGELGTVADINGDGVVGARDLSHVFAYWGECDL